MKRVFMVLVVLLVTVTLFSTASTPTASASPAADHETCFQVYYQYFSWGYRMHIPNCQLQFHQNVIVQMIRTVGCARFGIDEVTCNSFDLMLDWLSQIDQGRGIMIDYMWGTNFIIGIRPR